MTIDGDRMESDGSPLPSLLLSAVDALITGERDWTLSADVSRFDGGDGLDDAVDVRDATDVSKSTDSDPLEDNSS